MPLLAITKPESGGQPELRPYVRCIVPDLSVRDKHIVVTDLASDLGTRDWVGEVTATPGEIGGDPPSVRVILAPTGSLTRYGVYLRQLVAKHERRILARGGVTKTNPASRPEPSHLTASLRQSDLVTLAQMRALMRAVASTGRPFMATLTTAGGDRLVIEA